MEENIMKQISKKVIGLSVAALALTGAIGVGIGAVCFPQEVEVPVIKEVNVTKTVEVPVNVTVVKEVPVEVIKTVSVDNGNLAKVMDFVSDNVDEEADVEYILFEMDAKIESEALINNEMVSMLDDLNDAFDNELNDYRKSEVSVVSISDAEIVDRDFEDKDLELLYEVKVKAKEDIDNKEYFYYNVTVPFEEGKIVKDDIEVVLQ